MKKIFVVLVVCASACLPDDPDLEGRPCPCLDNTYACIDDVCVLASEVDAGSPDAGIPDAVGDAAEDAADAFGRDGGMQDTGPATDASRNDAGVEDAGAADTGADAGPMDVGPDVPLVGTFCERHGGDAYRCLDFETDPATVGWTAELMGAGSELTLDSSRAVSGSSLRVTAEMGGFANYRQVVPGVESGTFWHRARVYVDDPSFDFWSLMAVGGIGMGNDQYTHVALNSGQRVFVSHRRAGVENASSSAGSYAADNWFCLEASVNVEEGGEVNLYLDGALVVSESVDGRGIWSRLNVGSVGSIMAAPSSTVWIDDYVFSPTRVPCNLE